jgi:hypothetical protein
MGSDVDRDKCYNSRMVRGGRLPFLLPVLVGVIVVGSVVGMAAVRASSQPSLPPIEPDELIASTLQALGTRAPVSGRVDARLDLGLPQPLVGALAERAGPLASVLGDHRLRVWRSADGLRISDLLTLGERSLSVSRPRGEAWAWDSRTFAAYRLGGIPEGGHPHVGGSPAGSLLDPLELARRSLEAASATTLVEVRGTTRVAGRDAYLMVAVPRTDETLVQRIEIAIDAEHRLPLRVAVHARGTDEPSLAAAFTSVDFGPIDPSVYVFSPPPGATVSDLEDEGSKHAGRHDHSEGDGAGNDAHGRVVSTFGEGWATIVAVRLSSDKVKALSVGEPSPLSFLPLSSNLFSIRLADRGDHAWLLYGAVSQTELLEAEAKLS